MVDGGCEQGETRARANGEVVAPPATPLHAYLFPPNEALLCGNFKMAAEVLHSNQPKFTQSQFL